MSKPNTKNAGTKHRNTLSNNNQSALEDRVQNIIRKIIDSVSISEIDALESRALGLIASLAPDKVSLVNKVMHIADIEEADLRDNISPQNTAKKINGNEKSSISLGDIAILAAVSNDNNLNHLLKKTPLEGRFKDDQFKILQELGGKLLKEGEKGLSNLSVKWTNDLTPDSTPISSTNRGRELPQDRSNGKLSN